MAQIPMNSQGASFTSNGGVSTSVMGGSNMSAYAAAAGAALQIWSGVQQAEVIRMNAQVTDHINTLNAKYAAIDAYEEEKRGYGEIDRYEPQITSTLADQRVGYAAQNVDVSYGTAAAVQSETKLTGFLNKLDMEQEVRAKALGMKRQARGISLQNSMAQSQSEMNARSAIGQAVIGAANTGLSAYARK